jgi:hypothetical protein
MVDALLEPAAFDHAAPAPELVETHISWLILAGDFVYKIKKPLKLDFLDFSELDKRRFYCEEEIRLNRPWAPQIYLDVVPVTVAGGHYKFGGAGKVVEYALRMKRFDRDLTLDRQLELGALSAADMKELGQNIAARHKLASAVDSAERGRVIRLTKTLMEDNFAALDGRLDAALLAPLRKWTSRELARRSALLEARFDSGFVRNCHGDLHLGNLVRLRDGITSFDCIEFNTDLRHIDTMCDVAFLVMDLVARKRGDLASHFLNRYLEASGDYAAVAVLNLFFVYRCLVRAKVAVIRSDERDNASDRSADLAEVLAYGDMAIRQTRRRPAMLLIMHGYSGTGKTRVAEQLMAALPAIRVRSDVERKRLFGLEETATSGSAIDAGIYSETADRQVYATLNDIAEQVLDAGHNVILDAAFLAAADRRAAATVAERAGRRMVIVNVVADDNVVAQRLAQRKVAGDDASEAGFDVVRHQQSTADELSRAERHVAIDCDNSVSCETADLIKKVMEKAGRDD